MKAAHETPRQILTVPEQLAMDMIQNLPRRTRHPRGRADESETSCASRGTLSSLTARSKAWAENTPPTPPLGVEVSANLGVEWQCSFITYQGEGREDVRTRSPFRSTQVQALAWLSVEYYFRNLTTQQPHPICISLV